MLAYAAIISYPQAPLPALSHPGQNWCLSSCAVISILVEKIKKRRYRVANQEQGEWLKHERRQPATFLDYVAAFLHRIRLLPLSWLSLSLSKRLLLVVLSYGLGIAGL